MFDHLLVKVSLALVSVATAIAGLFGIASKHDIPPTPDMGTHFNTLLPERMIGATIPVVVSLFETSLQSSISTSDTSMTLVSGTDRAGVSLSGYSCFTIDEGSSSAEFVC